MQLDSARNHIILVNAYLSLFGTAIMLATAPAALLGMHYCFNKFFLVFIKKNCFEILFSHHPWLHIPLTLWHRHHAGYSSSSSFLVAEFAPKLEYVPIMSPMNRNIHPYS
jgi:hypothetical protein